tara:strand:- start:1563 stop:3965 length:2403 start_codon:yes stop_codon:yes gene_type:complete
MLPVAGTPVAIPSLANINLNQNVLRGTRTQHRSQQSVGGRVLIDSSDEDEEDDEVEEDEPGDLTDSQYTNCNEEFDDPEGFCKDGDTEGVVGMDLDDDAEKEEHKRNKRKADQLGKMAENARKLTKAEASLKRLREAKEAYETEMAEYIDVENALSEEQIQEKEAKLANLLDEVAMAQYEADETQTKPDTDFTRKQQEQASIVAQELQRFENQGRGFGVVKTAIENRVRAEVNKKYNTDPAKQDKLDAKLDQARREEQARVDKWLNKDQSNTAVVEQDTQGQQVEENKRRLKAILDERMDEALEKYPEGAQGIGVVREAIKKRVKAEWALDFKPLTDYKDEDGKRHNDYVAKLNGLLAAEKDAKDNFATKAAKRSAKAQQAADNAASKAVTAEQKNAESTLRSAQNRLQSAEAKMEALEAFVQELTNELEVSRAHYEETFMTPEQREEAENERKKEECKPDEEAIYKLRWVLSQAMDDFNKMVNEFQGKKDGGETRHPEEDCYTKLYGEEGTNGTIAPEPIPEWMKEIQVILNTAKDAIEAAEKNDPVGWEVESGEGDDKENLYTKYKEMFDDPDGEQKAEDEGLAEIQEQMLDPDDKLVAMTVIVKNNTLTDQEKMQLIKLDAFERLPNRNELMWPPDIENSFVTKEDNRKTNIEEYITKELMEESGLPQVEHIDWGSMRVYRHAIQKKKEHPNATDGSANYGINEVREVTLESVAKVEYVVEFIMKDSAGEDWEKGALEILKYLNDADPYRSKNGDLTITDIIGNRPFTEEQKNRMQAEQDKMKRSDGRRAAMDTTKL